MSGIPEPAAAETLARSYLMRGVPAEVVESLAREVRRHRFEAGATVLRQGGPRAEATAVMIVLIRTPQILGFLGVTQPVIPDFFGVNAQGIGTVGMLINFAVTIVVSLVTPPPPADVQEMVESIRYPRVMPAATPGAQTTMQGAAGG